MDKDPSKHYSRSSRLERRGEHPHYREQRPRPMPRREEHFERREREEAVPKPIGDSCNTLCPLFRCGKKALFVKLVSGKPVAYCTWVNDTCIGYKCQYASCAIRYLLPSGKCLAAFKNLEKTEDDFLKEIEKEKGSESLKALLSRRGLRKDLGIEDI